MTFSQQQLRLYAVTDTRWLRPGETLETVVESLLRGGVTMVQLRDKHADRQQLCAAARALLPVCHRHGAPLIINDYPDIALEVNADGVHVGQDDMAYAQARRLLGADKIIGVSAHNPDEALQAQAAGADYLGCGAVFGSATKNGVQMLTPAGLRAICAAVSLPVVGIGGIDEHNVEQLNGCGASGIAVVSALFAPADKQAAAQRLRALAERMVQG